MKRYDLEERTTKFAKDVIRLCRSLPRDPVNDRLISQVVGASGSEGIFSLAGLPIGGESKHGSGDYHAL